MHTWAIGRTGPVRRGWYGKRPGCPASRRRARGELLGEPGTAGQTTSRTASGSPAIGKVNRGGPARTTGSSSSARTRLPPWSGTNVSGPRRDDRREGAWAIYVGEAWRPIEKGQGLVVNRLPERGSARPRGQGFDPDGPIVRAGRLPD